MNISTLRKKYSYFECWKTTQKMLRKNWKIEVTKKSEVVTMDIQFVSHSCLIHSLVAAKTKFLRFRFAVPEGFIIASRRAKILCFETLFYSSAMEPCYFLRNENAKQRCFEIKFFAFGAHKETLNLMVNFFCSYHVSWRVSRKTHKSISFL